MIYRVKFEIEAKQDMLDAYYYYEECGSGLGDRFIDNLNDSIAYIQRNPNQFKKLTDELREIKLSKFPYLIIYQVVNQDIIIAAMFHCSRNPKDKFRNKGES